MTFNRDNNGLNQYANWTPSVINYDDDYGPPWGSPGLANGVMMQDGFYTCSFNAINQPISMWTPTLPAGLFFYYGFDPLGRCVKRWLAASDTATPTSSTFLYYDGWNLVQEGPDSATVDRIYAHGNRVDETVASQYGGAWRYHHYDARGHCILLTDASGAIVEQYDYDAFGKPYFYNASGASLPNGSSVGNRFLFTGREYLKDMQTYDFRNRLYQPELGRFIQPDPKEFEAGDYNLYRYCHNDPVNKSDWSGLDYVLLNDSEAVHNHGHNAVLVGNDRDHWMYFSKDGAEHGRDLNTAKPFESLKAFQESKESTRYDRGLRITTSSEADKAMKESGEKNLNKKFDVDRENCADLAGDVGKSGKIDVEKPKVGGLIHRNATDPNKQYEKLKEKLKDQAAAVTPHIK